MLAMDNMITNHGGLLHSFGSEHHNMNATSCSYRDKVSVGLKIGSHHKRSEFSPDDSLWQEKYYNTAHLGGMDTHQTVSALPYTNPPLHQLTRAPAVQPPPSLTNDLHNAYSQSGKPSCYHNFNGGTASSPTFQWHPSFHEPTHQQHQRAPPPVEHTHASSTTTAENAPAHSYSMNNRFDMFLRNQSQTNYFITSFTETSNNWYHHQPSPTIKDTSSHLPISKNVCPVCGKSYARPSTLKTHMRIHSGERPFLCEVCNKSFSQAANLTAHLRVHSGEKPFSCNICHKTFSQSSSVTTHMRTHSGDRPYKCAACRKGFSDSSTLTKHLRIHSGEKPYQCNYCTMSFSQSGNLNRHMKVHDHNRDHLEANTSKTSSPSNE